jgi:trimeric autotransporter adhesin
MALHVCVRGIGIRRSKDLRAEIGKCPNSTNERKNMSTKTLRKRIALVAIAALGTGVLSVAPANASTGVFVTAGIRVIGTTIVAPANATTAQIITIGTNSSVLVTAVAGTAAEGVFTVSGGTITNTSEAPDLVAPLTSATSFVFGDTTATVTFTPNVGESLMIINAFQTTAKRTAGTPDATLSVTIRTGAVGVVSPADSFVSVVEAATTADPSNNVDVTAGKTVADGTNGRINFLLKDANGVELGSTAVVTATASAGCLVAATNVTTAFLSASVSSAYPIDEVFVARAVSRTAANCTITLTVNGVALGTKTLILQGKVTKLEVIGGQAGISNAFASATTSANAFAYNATDAAGNIVYAITPTFNDTPSAAFASSSNSAAATLAVGYGLGSITCTGVARGSGTFFLSHTNSAGELIKSPVYTANCFGNAYTYTASLDKASYVPGDIATLTITARDASGNPANDYVYLGGTVTGTGTTLAPSIAGSNMTVITTPTSTDLFSAGKKTYKFIVGSTEGSYQLAVDLPKFNASTTPQDAVAVAYKIALSSATVSNADVLKAIVSLIASINKQIAALQKALLRR